MPIVRIRQTFVVLLVAAEKVDSFDPSLSSLTVMEHFIMEGLVSLCSVEVSSQTSIIVTQRFSFITVLKVTHLNN